MKITGLSHLFKWENLHNWWLTKYFFSPLYIYIYIYIYINSVMLVSRVKNGSMHNELVGLWCGVLWTRSGGVEHSVPKIQGLLLWQFLSNKHHH